MAKFLAASRKVAGAIYMRKSQAKLDQAADSTCLLQWAFFGWLIATLLGTEAARAVYTAPSTLLVDPVLNAFFTGVQITFGVAVTMQVPLACPNMPSSLPPRRSRCTGSSHIAANLNLRVQALRQEDVKAQVGHAKQNDDLPAMLGRRVGFARVLLSSLVPAFLNTNGGSIVRDLLADSGAHDATVGIFAVLVTSRAKILLNYAVQIVIGATFWWQRSNLPRGTAASRGRVADSEVATPNWVAGVWLSIGTIALVDLCLPRILFTV
jgi:hypothetical protein